MHVIDYQLDNQFMLNTQPTMSFHDFHLGGKPLFTHCDSDFGNFLRECLQFWEDTPLVREAVEKDLRVDALASKHERRLQERDALLESTRLWDCEEAEGLPQACSMELQTGRPRMPAKMVFLFCMIRGWFGSVCSAKVRDWMIESNTLGCILDEHGMRRPGITTILENINVISEQTLRLIHRLHLRRLAGEGLDDFADQSVDSTSVEASSAWPTDSKLIYKFLRRAVSMSSKLGAYGFADLSSRCIERWLEDIRKADFEIAMASGKAGAARQRRNGYRRVGVCASKILERLIKKVSRLLEELPGKTDLTPLRREACRALLNQIAEDLVMASRKMKQASERVENGIKAKVQERILSVADQSAVFIVKGEREPVLGYKPQLARSKKGVVTALIIEEGNGSDSKALVPLVKESMSNTNRPIITVTADDGYSSSEGLEEVRSLGVEKVSISGAKGRRLLGEELWHDEEYQRLRNDRSPVESLMFVLKYSFAFDRMGRRGIESVRKEMYEKVLAYNFARVLLLRSREQRGPPGARQAA